MLRRVLRTAARLGAVVAVAFAALALLDWALRAGGEDAGAGFLVVLLVVYATLIALPFMPGVEIGLALLAMEGAAIAPAVYGATAAGLMIAYLAGSHLPWGAVRRALLDVGWTRSARCVERFRKVDARRRLALLRRAVPKRIASLALRRRYLLLALLFNMPGNVVIGGGGGIAALAGLSGVFATAPMALTIALAVAPVPLLVYVFDMPPIW